jgi:hypothetical protein
LITGPTPVCTGNTLGYSTESGMTNYIWNVLSGGTITSGGTTNAVSVNWTATGTHSLTVTYINTSLCPTLTATVKAVSVNQTPTPSITGTDSTCQDGTIVFTTEPGLALYNWSVSAGGLITAGQGTNSVSVKWTLAGTRSVTVTYTSTNGCPGTTVKNITVYSPPVPVIAGPAFGCAGGTGTLFTTATGMTNYSWSYSPGYTVTSGGS